MQRIGRYEIEKELGRGAMGAVFRARDPQIGRTVAIKVILTANLAPDDLQQYKLRFYREAQAAGQMSHPGIVTIHDITEDESGQPFLVMEFIEGTPLDRKMSERTGELLPMDESLAITHQVALALDYAHRRGVIHRDVKPANVMVTPDGHCKIADFGIAKLEGTQLTQTGHLLGTPAYMSPEQFSGAAVDSRSDLFSLGAMLYWMLTGEKPFAGETLTAVSFKVVFTAPIPVHQLNPALPVDLDTVISRCLAKNPADRYGTCKELAADLDALRRGKPITATPLPAAAAVPAAVLEATTVAPRPGVGPATVAVPPPVPQEKTVPLAASRVEKTVALPKTAAPERTIAIPHPAPRKGRGKLWAALAALLLVLGAPAAWFLWTPDRGTVVPSEKPPAELPKKSSPRRIEAPPPPPAEKQDTQEQSTEEQAAPEEKADSGPPPWAPAKGRRRQAAASVPMSTLKVICEHNFKDGRIEITVEGSRIFESPLRGEKTDLYVGRVYQGVLRDSASIPAGQQRLRVKVTSSSDGYSEEDEIGGNFPADGARTLFIEFGKGSAFGVVDRKLTMRWR